MPHLSGTIAQLDGDAARKRVAVRTCCINARIPRRIMELFEDATWRPTEGYERLKEAVVSGSRMVVLWGNPGVGKSVAGAREIARVGTGFFADAAELADELMVSEWRRDRSQFCGCLVLDDAGREADFKRTKTLLRKRYDSSLLTIITTNWTPEQILGIYGRHIDERIREKGCYLEFKERMRETG